MSKHLYWLDDASWAAIEPLLPQGRRGVHRVDDRRVISGIMHWLRTGARWRECPADYGPYTTICNRFNRWSKQGVREDIFYALTGSSGVIGGVTASCGGADAWQCPRSERRARSAGHHRSAPPPA